MRKAIILSLLLVSMFAVAQPDPLTYHVILKDSSAFNCRIPYQIPKKMIRVKKGDNSEQIILWENISSINIIDSSGHKVNINTISKSDIKALKKAENIKMEHQRWNNCFIVKQTADTIYGRVKGKADYSSSGDYSVWSADFWTDGTLQFSYADDTEEYFTPADIKEIYLIGRSLEYSKYISAENNLYRVITDGDCKLVYNEANNVNAAGIGANGLISTAGGRNNQRFFIYYKGFLTLMRTEVDNDNMIPFHFNLSIGFKEKCREIFTECPSLVEQIENKTLRSVDLREIVKEFNKCIAQK